MSNVRGNGRGNGYLRQVEFRRWAEGVDHALGSLTAKVEEHGQLLAVVKDRQQQRDTRKNVVGATIAAIISTLISVLGRLGGH